MLEPVIASVLAVPLFQEIPTSIQCVGYALILAAVAVVARTSQIRHHLSVYRAVFEWMKMMFRQSQQGVCLSPSQIIVT
jgi:hypothetical protein